MTVALNKQCGGQIEKYPKSGKNSPFYLQLTYRILDKIRDMYSIALLNDYFVKSGMVTVEMFVMKTYIKLKHCIAQCSLHQLHNVHCTNCTMFIAPIEKYMKLQTVRDYI
ncbi:unnamed protein product [Owenia fusiformis]|uniref:Uncharacterized protein n=1 Tax=Owenia fusiformis TaxID=6347 RepID=A0A8J1UIV5_OWEFU|nr:unnamed protein product [Owenia fusiformis]